MAPRNRLDCPSASSEDTPLHVQSRKKDLFGSHSTMGPRLSANKTEFITFAT